MIHSRSRSKRQLSQCKNVRRMSTVTVTSCANHKCLQQSRRSMKSEATQLYIYARCALIRMLYNHNYSRPIDSSINHLSTGFTRSCSLFVASPNVTAVCRSPKPHHSTEHTCRPAQLSTYTEQPNEPGRFLRCPNQNMF